MRDDLQVQQRWKGECGVLNVVVLAGKKLIGCIGIKRNKCATTLTDTMDSFHRKNLFST